MELSLSDVLTLEVQPGLPVIGKRSVDCLSGVVRGVFITWLQISYLMFSGCFRQLSVEFTAQACASIILTAFICLLSYCWSVLSTGSWIKLVLKLSGIRSLPAISFGHSSRIATQSSWTVPCRMTVFHSTHTKCLGLSTARHSDSTKHVWKRKSCQRPPQHVLPSERTRKRESSGKYTRGRFTLYWSVSVCLETS